MKNSAFTFILLTFILTSCKDSNSNNTTLSTSVQKTPTQLNVQGETKTPSQHKYTIDLNNYGFLTKVMDYKKNPDKWEYMGDKPAIIDFYASWCGPCKKISPILEELAKTYNGKIYVYKVNTDKEKELSNAFGISSLPSILFIPLNGNPEMTIGAASKIEIQNYIENFLLKN